MREVSLTLDSKGLAGYKPSFLELVHSRAPHCLGRITSLTIVLTKESHHFACVLRLFGAAPLVFLSVEADHNNMDLLQPLQHAKTLQRLAVSSGGSHEFWSHMPTFWMNLTSIHFTEEGVGAPLECALPALTQLPHLHFLQLVVDEADLARNAHHFPTLAILEALCFTGNHALKLVEALDVPHLQKLDLSIASPERENVFTMLHTEITASFGNSLTDLSVGIAYPDWDGSLTSDFEHDWRDELILGQSLHSLSGCMRLTRLRFSPHLSCHLLTDEFYSRLALVWPGLEEFQLGGNLLYPLVPPRATINGLVSFLHGAPHIQVLSFPFVAPRKKPYPAVEKKDSVKNIGLFVERRANLVDFLPWIRGCCPGLSYLSVLPSADSDVNQSQIATLKNEGCHLNIRSFAVWCVDDSYIQL